MSPELQELSDKIDGEHVKVVAIVGYVQTLKDQITAVAGDKDATIALAAKVQTDIDQLSGALPAEPPPS